MNPALTTEIHGVYCAAATPVTETGAVDHTVFAAHCKALLAEGCHGIAMLGTTGEANSLGLAERQEMLERVIEAGIEPSRLLPGTSQTNVADTLALTRHAVQAGVKGVVLLPPFYYKGVSDDGLFSYFSEVIERVDRPGLQLYLYHFPAVSQVPLSVALVERLLKRYPGIVAGIKDSSGDWNSMKAYIDNFAASGFDVFPGTETHLLNALRAGGAGCISATANVNPAQISGVARDWRKPEVEAANDNMVAIRAAFQRYPLLPAMKKAIAAGLGDPSWAVLRPPLVALDDASYEKLAAELAGLGFRFGR